MASTLDVLELAQDLLEPQSLMSAAEIARQAAMARQEDRDDFVAARVLARIVLTRHSGVPVGAEALRSFAIRQTCAVCGGPHGRPEVVGMPRTGLSWAHSHGWVAAAAGPGSVGVDVEPVGDPTPTGVRAALAWTRAEALVKFGHGDLDTADSWRLSADPAPSGQRYRLRASGPPRVSRWGLGPAGRTAVLTDVVRPGVAATVAATLAAQPVDLRGSALQTS